MILSKIIMNNLCLEGNKGVVKSGKIYPLNHRQLNINLFLLILINKQNNEACSKLDIKICKKNAFLWPSEYLFRENKIKWRVQLGMSSPLKL